MEENRTRGGVGERAISIRDGVGDMICAESAANLLREENRNANK